TTVSRLTISGRGGLPVSGSNIPADILFSGLGSVTVNLGKGNDLVTVSASPAGTTTTFNTADGNDQVAVQGMSGPVNVNTGNGNDTVYVGSKAGFWPTTGQFTDVNGNTLGVGATLTVNTGAGSDTM